MAITFESTTLDNGLTILAEIDAQAHSAAAGIFVRTGARDETPRLMGVSHFLEHMIFKGTEKRTAEDVDRDFDDLGARHNAFTSTELTAFYAHVLPEQVDGAIEILGDILRPSIRQKDFDAEKKVILEEIAMYADQPFWNLYEQLMETKFGRHRLGHRVLGTVQTVTDMQRDAMQTYFDERYAADNTVVTLTGKLDFDDAVAAIEKACGHWKRTGTQRSFDALDPVSTRLDLTSEKVKRCYIIMTSDAPGTQDERKYACGVAAQILGDVDGSRLYWALVDTGLADEAQAWYDGHDGLGLQFAYASCMPENAKQVEDIIRTNMDGLVDSITEDDLLRMRCKIATAATMAGELPMGRMRRLGERWTYGCDYEPLEKELEYINAVTIDDVRRVMNEFPMTPSVTATLLPE